MQLNIWSFFFCFTAALGWALLQFYKLVTNRRFVLSFPTFQPDSLRGFIAAPVFIYLRQTFLTADVVSVFIRSYFSVFSSASASVSVSAFFLFARLDL